VVTVTLSTEISNLNSW